MQSSLTRLKNACVPDQTRFRELRFGVARGCTFPINFRHHTRIYFGVYEAEVRACFEAYAHDSSCCYDVGAANGYYSLAFAMRRPQGRIVAIEADPAVCHSLRDTVEQNPGLASRIQVLEFLMGNTTDLAARRATLDCLVRERSLPAPDFLKVDIEGAEYDFLAGAAEVFRRHSPKVIIEVHALDLERQCIALLEERGYRVGVIDRRSWFPEQRGLEHNRWIYGQRI